MHPYEMPYGANALAFRFSAPLRPGKQEGRIPEGRRARCATFPDGTWMCLPEMPDLLAHRPCEAWTAGRPGGLLWLLDQPPAVEKRPWPHKKVTRAKRGFQQPHGWSTLLLLASIPRPESHSLAEFRMPVKKPAGSHRQASHVANLLTSRRASLRRQRELAEGHAQVPALALARQSQ